MAAPVCAMGQTAKTDTVTGPATTLMELEVSGRSATPTLESAAPTHRLSAERIRTTGVTDMADALHRLPGINLRDYGGSGGQKTVSVRGFGAGHTAVSYDGVVLSEVQGGSVDVSRYSLDNVGALQLTVGDNADIFIPSRAAASAASLEISTESPFDSGRRSPSAVVQLRGGSFGFINPFAKFTKRMGKVTAQLLGEYIHADNDYPFTLVNGDLVTREKRQNTRMNSWHTEANAVWRITPRQSLAFKAYYYDNARHLPGPVIYYVTTSHERLREQNAFAQARYKGALSSTVSLMALAKFNWSSSLYHDEDGKYPGGELNQNYWQREAYAAASVLWEPLDWLTLDYAADYFYNNLNSNLPKDNRPFRNSILQSATAKGKFGGLTVMARGLLSLYYNGARSGEAAKDARKLSPSLSLSWRPFTEQEFYTRLSYKNIFRMPTFNEAYFDHYGSVDILPESTDQLNLGLTYGLPQLSWLPEATFTLDGYVNHVKDMIVAVPYNMFIWTMVNLGKVRVFGLDATVNTRFVPAKGQGIILAANYSYQRAQPRTDRTSTEWMKQVAYIPLNSGGGSLTWENPWVNAVFHTTGVSARYTTNNNLPQTRIDGYMECGVTLYRTFSLGKSRLEVRADLINMFDKQYEVVANYPMPGRSWQLTVKWTI